MGIADDIQSTVRADPEAFLARSVIVCEGASEVGLIRGLDHYWTALNGNARNEREIRNPNVLIYQLVGVSYELIYHSR